MANETVLSGITNVAAYVAADMSPYFRTNVVMLNLCAMQNFREKTPGVPGSASLKFGKKGNVTFSVTSEAASATKAAYAETSVSITAQKGTTYVELTKEAELFGNDQADLAYLTADAGAAAADKFDVDALALADSFTNSTGTTNTVLTANNLKNAPYKVRLGKVKGPLVMVLHPTQIRDLQADIITTTAPVYSSSNVNLDILGGQPSANNGRAGSLFGVDIYESTNTKSINTATDWAGLCFNPQWALAAGILGRFIVMGAQLPQTVVTGLSVSMFYNVAIWNQAAGCYIISKQ